MFIGELIQNWRHMERVGIRDCAKIIGISPSTLSRVENGKPTDSETLTKILKWILEE